MGFYEIVPPTRKIGRFNDNRPPLSISNETKPLAMFNDKITRTYIKQAPKCLPSAMNTVKEMKL